MVDLRGRVILGFESAHKCLLMRDLSLLNRMFAAVMAMARLGSTQMIVKNV
ncbi:hypothetical protein D3C72_2507150 [compost metagenome]